MSQRKPIPPTVLALGAALLAGVGAWRPPELGAAPAGPAYAVRLTPGATPDGNPNDNVDQQPAVLAQWNSSGTTRASLDHIVEKLDRDGEGRRVERSRRLYPSGRTAWQDTKVRAKLRGSPLLREVVKAWDPSGRQTYRFTQADDFDANGNQVGGERSTLNYSLGRLTRERKERWDPAFGGWLETYDRTSSYDGDGDLRQRITEEPALDRETKEIWGAGRLKAAFRWDPSARRWAASPAPAGAPDR